MAMIFASTSAFCFLAHKPFKEKYFFMFSKSKKIINVPEVTTISPAELAKAPDPVQKADEIKNNTIISSDVLFEGNITATGFVYIYGQLHGNLVAQGGTVKIMNGSYVKGDITCRDLIVDGSVFGQCHSDSLTIETNGRIDGTVIYADLCIKRGGIFHGHAETFTKEEKLIAKDLCIVESEIDTDDNHIPDKNTELCETALLAVDGNVNG
jgi:cytoskeletal protein CcmA (bactofilin family)